MSTTTTYKEYANKGITGLKNLGNTCFMNSVIQCLSHTYELNEFLDKKTDNEFITISKKNDDGVILKEWNDLRKLMYSENCNISPGGFLTNVQKLAVLKNRELFTGFAQNDFSEFLLFLCDCFHDALKRQVNIEVSGVENNPTDVIAKKCYNMIQTNYKNDYSEIFQFFYGVQVSNIYKKIDNEQLYDKTSAPLSSRPETFFMLDLCIPNNNETTKNKIYLSDCIQTYCEPEILEGDNMWFNEKTNQKEPVIKMYQFFSLPTVLIISIKRFTQYIKKDNTDIQIEDIDEPIDFSPYICGYNPSQYKYEIYAVCNHYGSTMGGHYTTHIRNANGKWYLFDDMNKKEIDKQDVITQNMYCLFMRKCKL